MQAKLIVVGGKATKGSISLTLPTVVGRSQQAGLTIGHRTISRRHAELFEKAGMVMIRDLGSLNGTIIDGQRIKEAPLPPDAEFTIGPLTFRVQYEYKGDRSKSPPRVLADKTGDDGAATEPLTELPDFEPIDEEPAKKAPPKETAREAPAKELPDFELIDEQPAKKAPPKERAATEKEAPVKARATTDKEASAKVRATIEKEALAKARTATEKEKEPPVKEEVQESAVDPFEDLLNELQ